MLRISPFFALLCLGLGGCNNAAPGFILHVTGEAKADWLSIYVRDDRSKQVVTQTGFEQVVDANKNSVDITTTPLTVTLMFSEPAPVTLLLVGAIGAQPSGNLPDPENQLFWATRVNVTAVEYVNAQLLLVGQDDMDRDLWPSAATWPGHNANAALLYAQTPFLLDCDDNMDYDSLGLHAADINPFAKEKCTDNLDEDCDGVISPCVDADGDGDPAGDDCDDNDPARHHATVADPYPDPPNCCGYSLGKMSGDPDYHTNFLGQSICPMQRCGDGIDESCKGSDTACVVDADCDGYAACAAGQTTVCDCNDSDPNTHPGAAEPCGSTTDLNCSGIIGDGCVNCDIDGDGYERLDATQHCPDANDKHPGMPDCNDFDFGVHPSQTSELGGSGMEGGGTATQLLISALRGNCRHYYDTASTYPKIAAGTEAAPGDADCDGTAYAGCPSAACDADGDGFMNAGCSPPAGEVDCNDSDPTIFPNAPDKCGDGIISNCAALDTTCASIVDADGDGYSVSNGDCNDNDASIHPWAVEVCDGKDNDCDGLIDEGNPSATGAPLTTGTNVTVCTTDNDGECGKTPGLCVCSSSPTNAVYDPGGNRVTCPTEIPNTRTGKTPQCYFSGQPSKDLCDGLDNECIGAGFVDGSGQCTGVTKICRASDHTCVQCLSVGDCTGPETCNAAGMCI